MSSSGLDSSQSCDDTTTAQPAHTSPSSSTAGIVNPLVAAGLIPPDLADILATPADAATQRRVRRVTKARVLTAQEYVEMMQEKDKQEKEAAEQKQKRKEERERKKIERAEKKQEKGRQQAEKKRKRAEKVQ